MGRRSRGRICASRCATWPSSARAMSPKTWCRSPAKNAGRLRPSAPRAERFSRRCPGPLISTMTPRSSVTIQASVSVTVCSGIEEPPDHLHETVGRDRLDQIGVGAAGQAVLPSLGGGIRRGDHHDGQRGTRGLDLLADAEAVAVGQAQVEQHEPERRRSDAVRTASAAVTASTTSNPARSRMRLFRKRDGESSSTFRMTAIGLMWQGS